MLLFQICSGVFKRISLLLPSYHDWFTLLDQQMEIMCVFFDFKKAFDTVPHRKLMNILCEIDTHPLLRLWLCSYLSFEWKTPIHGGQWWAFRTLPCVVWSPTRLSAWPTVIFDLYQQSHLYTPIWLYEAKFLILYADDLLIYKPILTETSHLQLQSDINSISLWADNNLMKFNEAKCKCMLLTNKKTLYFQLLL